MGIRSTKGMDISNVVFISFHQNQMDNIDRRRRPSLSPMTRSPPRNEVTKQHQELPPKP